MDILLPATLTMFIWWFSTGALLILVRLRSSSHALSLALGALVVGGAFAAIEHSLSLPGVEGVWIGFVAAVLIWGWLEMAYLMGVLTGPVQTACPAGLNGWPRFLRAVNVGLYQEFLVIIAGGVLVILASGSVNPVAGWTFATLWFMRWSAKLNLFLGVPNVDSGLVPERLRYTVSYMAKAPMNWLFPLSITLGTSMVLYHAAAAYQSAPGTAAHSMSIVLAMLTGLGVIEHWFLVLPLKDSALWRWFLPAGDPGLAQGDAEPVGSL
jgi:putative photosynthetic complex assembly protein 2